MLFSSIVLLSTLFHDARDMSYFAGLQIFSRHHPLLTFLIAFDAACLSAARSHVNCYHVSSRSHPLAQQ